LIYPQPFTLPLIPQSLFICPFQLTALKQKITRGKDAKHFLSQKNDKDGKGPDENILRQRMIVGNL